ncbi:MAG: hypothetical protein EAX96_05215 [Candidatus Lokiarchaeota archaeon]|nr:hypothetical protein [Candidatus Lokiarchaeota archaeon]
MESQFEIWTEKYRPEKLDDVLENPEVISVLKSFRDNKNFPHLLINGPSGSGRLTAILSFLRELYGDAYGLNTFYINSNDDKTYYQEYLDYWYDMIKIELLRTKGYSKEPSNLDLLHGMIKLFAKKKSLGELPYKTLVINDAHLLTKMTQQALRRIMEKNVRTFRIILITESLSKIIDPIRSRCMILNFKKFSNNSIIRLIKMISKEEKFEITDEAIRAILYLSKRNLKKVINFLQAGASVSRQVDFPLIQEIYENISPKIKFKKIITACMFSNFNAIRDNVRKLFLEFGYDGKRIIEELNEEFLLLPYPENIKTQFQIFFSDADNQLNTALSEEVHIYYILAKISRYFRDELEKLAEA